MNYLPVYCVWCQRTSITFYAWLRVHTHIRFCCDIVLHISMLVIRLSNVHSQWQDLRTYNDRIVLEERAMNEMWCIVEAKRWEKKSCLIIQLLLLPLALSLSLDFLAFMSSNRICLKNVCDTVIKKSFYHLTRKFSVKFS